MKRHFTRATRAKDKKIRKQLLLAPEDISKVESLAHEYDISFGEAVRKIINKVDIENV